MTAIFIFSITFSHKSLSLFSENFDKYRSWSQGVWYHRFYHHIDTLSLPKTGIFQHTWRSVPHFLVSLSRIRSPYARDRSFFLGCFEVDRFHRYGFYGPIWSTDSVYTSTIRVFFEWFRGRFNEIIYLLYVGSILNEWTREGRGSS